MKKKVFNNHDFFKMINDTLLKKESVSFIVKGNSMSPFLRGGETEVFLSSKEIYRKNDICLFKYKGQYRLHRLLKIRKDLYYFRGDHLYQYEIIKRDNILGFVYKYVYNNKTVYVNQLKYHLKIKLYFIYKAINMLLRKFYLVVKHGK